MKNGIINNSILSIIKHTLFLVLQYLLVEMLVMDLDRAEGLIWSQL